MIKKIITVVDGYDVQTVNLWGDAVSRTKINGKCLNGDLVTILERRGEMVRVKNEKNHSGWCNIGFLVDVGHPDPIAVDPDKDLSIDREFYAANKEKTDSLRSAFKSWTKIFKRK